MGTNLILRTFDTEFHRYVPFQMERDRAKLLQQTFAELNSAFAGQNRRAHSAQPPLAVNRVKVTFRDEPGEGSGVARSFYTSVAEVLK